MTTDHEAIAHRRRNADAVGQATAHDRLYRRLLHVQIDLQEAADDEAEDLLLDLLDRFRNPPPALDTRRADA